LTPARPAKFAGSSAMHWRATRRAIEQERPKGDTMAKKAKIKSLKREVKSRKAKVARQEKKLKAAKKALKRAA
jgi:hypothetical protein